MIRFISFLLGKPYESCKSCETLKQQLNIANQEKHELTETLLNLIKPKTYEAIPVELQSTQKVLGTFSQRRAALEARDRETARVQANSKVLARPDSVLQNKNAAKDTTSLEQELGIEDSAQEVNQRGLN